jgi:hypothetical protein
VIHLDRNGDDVRTWAGYVSARRNRATGTLIVVIDDRSGRWSSDSLADYGDGTAPWWTVCDDHGVLIQHQSRRLATAHAAAPEGWCEGCMELTDKEA